MKRLFVAIKILPNENFIKILSKLKHELKHEKIKWAEPKNIHLTLKFFGETINENIPKIIDILNTSLQNKNRFTMKIANIGIFGSKYKPKVIWAGIYNTDYICEIQNCMSKALEIIGYVNDRQNYVPHLTLGRIKFINDKPLFNDIILGFKTEYLQEITVSDIILFESKLTKKGAIYQVVKNFNLK